MLVDLLGVAVLAEEAAEDTHASEPDHLEGETGIGGTLALTVAWRVGRKRVTEGVSKEMIEAGRVHKTRHKYDRSECGHASMRRKEGEGHTGINQSMYIRCGGKY